MPEQKSKTSDAELAVSVFATMIGKAREGDKRAWRFLGKYLSPAQLLLAGGDGDAQELARQIVRERSLKR